MELSVAELSELMGVEVSTIDRWVKQGRLPLARGARGICFNPRQIEQWAARQGIRLNRARLDRFRLLRAGLSENLENPCCKLSSAVRNGGIFYVSGEGSKSEVLGRCITQMDVIPDEWKPDLLKRILEREAALSTGIGDGVAIPHPRDPMAFLEKPCTPVCILDNPLEYQSLDNGPVRILIFVLSNSLKHHLPILSALSLCLKDEAFTAFLKSAPSRDALIRRVEKIEG